MKKVYFDKTVFSDLIREQKSGESFIKNKIIKAVKTGKIIVYYSDQHIFESLKRPVVSDIIKELELISEISNNNFINDDLELTKEDPFIRSLILIKFLPFIDQMNDLFSNRLTNDQNYDKAQPLTPSRILNNLKSDNLFDEINKIIKSQNIEKSYSEYLSNNDNVLNLDSFIDDFSSIIIGFIANYFSLTPNQKEDLRNQIKRGTNSSLQKLEDTLKNASKLYPNIFENIFKTISEGLSPSPGDYSALLEKIGYWPDKTRVRKKKGPLGDMYDPAHFTKASKLDIYVTSDKRQLRRDTAVKDHKKLNVQIMDLEGFLLIV